MRKTPMFRLELNEHVNALDKIITGIGLGWLFLWIIGIGGWIANIVKLAIMVLHNDLITTLFVARVVGLFFAPLGAVLGFF